MANLAIDKQVLETHAVLLLCCFLAISRGFNQNMYSSLHSYKVIVSDRQVLKHVTFWFY